MSTLKIVKPRTEAERTTRTTLDTIEISPNLVQSWKLPAFQRPLRVNEKVRQLAEKIKHDDGVVPGVVTIGVLDKQQYLIDGQHRREAFLMSECVVGYVDVRIHYFDSMAEMGQEFVDLNSRIVTMRPDDILRGLEGSSETLTKLRRKCPFIGYDMIRRGEKSPLLSMSSVLRCWYGSSKETPSTSAVSVVELVTSFTNDSCDGLVEFLGAAIAAWGRDPQYQRLWLNLNLSLTMWLWRRMVITPYSSRTPKLTPAQFQKCMMSLSADSTYIDYLLGRSLTDRDRSPCYSRMKSLFSRRLEAETGKKQLLPVPPWSHAGGSK